jgi:tryptophan synthase alpha chain
MNRLSLTLEQLRAKSKKALIPFVTAGHPHPVLTVNTMHALVDYGANIIELGMPFSDPMADGATIQLSSEKALKLGMSMSLVLDSVSEFRLTNKFTPVILMGYLNPIEKFGYAEFISRAANAGVDGVLLVDCPPEESESLEKLLNKYDMSQIFLIAPTTDDTRIKYILSKAKGFIYCVALKGVTGAASVGYDDLFKQIVTINAQSDIPVAVGFGINDAKSATSVAQYADAVVIGSALVEQLDKCENKKEIRKTIKQFLKPIRQALDLL